MISSWFLKGFRVRAFLDGRPPRRPKRQPKRRPKEGPRTAEDSPKMPQDAPKTLLRELQEGPKKGNSNWPWEPLTPRWPQGPPTPKRPPRGLQEAPKSPPRGSQEAPGSLQEAPPKARALTRTPLHVLSNESVGFETHSSLFSEAFPGPRYTLGSETGRT